MIMQFLHHKQQEQQQLQGRDLLVWDAMEVI